MGSMIAGIVAAFIGGGLAVASAVTMVGLAGGPSPEQVAQDRQESPVGVEDLAYGNN